MSTSYLRSQNNGAKATELSKGKLDSSQHHPEVPRYQSFSQAQKLACGKGLNISSLDALGTSGLGIDPDY